MSRLKPVSKNIISGSVEELKKHLLAGDYIICCDVPHPEDIKTVVIQNVFCIKDLLQNGKPFIIQFAVSNNPDSELFSLHDGLSLVIENEDVLNGLLANIADSYSLFIKDDGNVDRVNIYGELGSGDEKEIVYKYEDGETDFYEI
ncbi:MAG: hypothetical protein GX684_07670 [Ruminococcaceae bacterium]|nr:hypothetical protein [Oscillospiraceae bacterium]